MEEPAINVIVLGGIKLLCAAAHLSIERTLMDGLTPRHFEHARLSQLNQQKSRSFKSQWEHQRRLVISLAAHEKKSPSRIAASTQRFYYYYYYDSLPDLPGFTQYDCVRNPNQFHKCALCVCVWFGCVCVVSGL